MPVRSRSRRFEAGDPFARLASGAPERPELRVPPRRGSGPRRAGAAAGRPPAPPRGAFELGRRRRRPARARASGGRVDAVEPLAERGQPSRTPRRATRSRAWPRRGPPGSRAVRGRRRRPAAPRARRVHPALDEASDRLLSRGGWPRGPGADVTPTAEPPGPHGRARGVEGARVCAAPRPGLGRLEQLEVPTVVSSTTRASLGVRRSQRGSAGERRPPAFRAGSRGPAPAAGRPVVIRPIPKESRVAHPEVRAQGVPGATQAEPARLHASRGTPRPGSAAQARQPPRARPLGVAPASSRLGGLAHQGRLPEGSLAASSPPSEELAGRDVDEGETRARRERRDRRRAGICWRPLPGTGCR